MKNYIVYTEIFTDDGFERWYYGTYENSNRANEVALALGHTDTVYHCVVSAEEASEWGIQGLPTC